MWRLCDGGRSVCAEFPIFKGTVSVPAGAKLEYKYVVVRVQKTGDGVQSQWEANNRLLTVPQCAPAPRPESTHAHSLPARLARRMRERAARNALLPHVFGAVGAAQVSLR